MRKQFFTLLLLGLMGSVGNVWGTEETTTYTFTSESVLTNAFDVTVNDNSNVVRTFNDNGLTKDGAGNTYSAKQLKIELKNASGKTFTAISKSSYSRISKITCYFGVGSSARGSIKLGIQVSTNKSNWTSGDDGVTTIVPESDTWQTSGSAYNNSTSPDNSKIYKIEYSFATPVTGYIRLYVTNTSSGKTAYFGPLSITTTDDPGLTATAAPSITINKAVSPFKATITNNESTAAGSVYYTTNGSTPTSSSMLYTSPFDVTSDCTIKAIFIPTNSATYANSSVTSETVEVDVVTDNTISTTWEASEALTAGQSLVNQNIRVKTVYASNQSTTDATIQGESYSKYVQIRVNSMSDAGEYTEKSGSTPLLISCRKSGILMLRYRRQTDNGEANGGFTAKSSKDVILSVSGSKTALDHCGFSIAYIGDNKYGVGVEQWELTEGTNYVLWSQGTTICVYGFTFAPNHSVSTFTPSDHYSTLFLDYDAIIPDGISAYKGSLDGTVLTLSELTSVIPANTAVVLKSDDGSAATFKKQLAKADAQASSLGGTISSVSASTVDVGDGALYALGVYESTTGFYPYSGTDLAANKAYLVGPAATSPGPTAPSIRFEIDGENNATEIQTINAVDKAVKFFRNGQLYIMRDGITYDAIGRIVK